MLHLSPLLLLRIEGLINKPMQALGKPVWQEKAKLTSREVRSSATSKAWGDLGRALFSLDLLQVDLSRAQRPSLEVDLFRLHGFESYYKFTRGKNDWHMLCRERREISRTVLLVNQCHDVTGRSFDRWISRQTGVKSPFNGITNQEAKNKGLLESLTFLLVSQEDKRKFCSQVAKELTLGPAPTA